MPNKTSYTYQIRIANRNNVQVEKTAPDGSSIGMPFGKFGYKGSRKKEIDLLVEQAATRAITAEGIKQLGEALFQALFDGGLQADFTSFYHNVVQQKEQLLRLELDSCNAVPNLPRMLVKSLKHLHEARYFVLGRAVIAD